MTKFCMLLVAVVIFVMGMFTQVILEVAYSYRNSVEIVSERVNP